MELFTVELTDLQAAKLKAVIDTLEKRNMQIPLLMQVSKDAKAIRIHLPDPKTVNINKDSPCKGCGECDGDATSKPLHIHPGTETLQ